MYSRTLLFRPHTVLMEYGLINGEVLLSRQDCIDLDYLGFSKMALIYQWCELVLEKGSTIHHTLSITYSIQGILEVPVSHNFYTLTFKRKMINTLGLIYKAYLSKIQMSLQILAFKGRQKDKLQENVNNSVGEKKLIV